MKSSRHIAWALLALLAAACGKDDLAPETTTPADGTAALVEMTFTAAAPETRTTLGEKGADGTYPVLWNDGDEIAVMPMYGRFDKSELEEMKFTTSIAGGTAATATFSGRTQQSENGYIAFYPHKSVKEYFNQYLFFTLPSEQQAVAGSFAPDLNPAVAMTWEEDENLQFKPICGLVKFTLTGDAAADIESVRLDVNVKMVSGTVAYYPSLDVYENWTDYDAVEYKTYVTLTGPFEAGQAYYMVVIPCALSNGFSLTVTRRDGMAYILDGEIDGSVESGRICNLGEIEVTNGMFDNMKLDKAFVEAVESGSNPRITFVRDASGDVYTTDENKELMASVKELEISMAGLKNGSQLKFFTGLEMLDCSGNEFTALDLGGMPDLKILSCGENKLLSLDLSAQTQLEMLLCYNNALETLVLNPQMPLTYLVCEYNALSTLDLSGLTRLEELYCDHNKLSSLDLSDQAGLKRLYCSYNVLETLPLNGLTQLEELNCTTNYLSELDLSGLTQLKTLHCIGNKLSTLDLSGLTLLEDLKFDHNDISTLDLKDQKQLKRLQFSYNNLSSLDLSSVPLLESLILPNNNFSTLDLSHVPLLKTLNCANNNFSDSGIDISGLMYLEDLSCNSNHLTAIDISKFDSMLSVFCGNQTNADDGSYQTMTLTLTAEQETYVWSWCKNINGNSYVELNVVE